MEIVYNFKVKRAEYEGVLVPTEEPVTSDFYFNKEFDWLKFKVNVNEEKIYNKGILYSVERLDTKTVFKVNTLNIKLTDIVINDEPYFFKINTTSEHSLEELERYSNQKVKFHKGSYYVNKPFYVFISEYEIISTEDVIRLDDCKIIYRHDGIEVETVKNAHILIKNLIDSSTINEYSFRIPSFYPNRKGKNIPCIESNLKIFNSKIDEKTGGFFKYVNLDSKNNFNVALRDYNKESQRCFLSSHCFYTDKKKTHYKIHDNGSIVLSTEEDYDFEIERYIDYSKLELIPNNYKRLDTTINNILGKYVKIFSEVNPKINPSGLVYRKTSNLFNLKEYLTTRENSLKYSTLQFKEPNPKLKSQSIEKEGAPFRVLTGLLERDFLILDNITYNKPKE